MVDVALVKMFGRSVGTVMWNARYGLPGMLADSLPDTYGRALFELP